MTDDAADATGGAVPVSRWNLPNLLSFLRILLVPLLGWLLLSYGGQDNAYRFWAFVVFVAAISTDKVDGELARRQNLVTDLGKILDPIADKALTGMAFVGLSLIGELWWWVTIVILFREWSITLLRMWVIRYGVMAASRGGKIKTTTQALGLSLLLLPLRQFGGPWEPWGLGLWWLGVVVMGVAVAVTVVTGLDYVRQALRLRTAGGADEQHGGA